jgi:hypothetical protein
VTVSEIPLYSHNGMELRVIRHSPLTQHVEVFAGGERVAVIDSLGILQPGDNTRTAYVEIRILNHGGLGAQDDEHGTSYLYEVD